MTLIELLTVLAIVAIIMAVLLPAFVSAREHSRQADCLSNERQLAAGMQLYINDNDETFPPSIQDAGTGWAAKCYAYVNSAGVYHCPDDPTKIVELSQGPPLLPVSYGFNSNLGGYVYQSRTVHLSSSLPVLVSPSKTLLFFEVSGAITALPNPTSNWPGNSASGNGASDCGPESNPTYPCGTFTPTPTGGEIPEQRYATGNIGGRSLNGGSGSIPRHNGGANYVACDGHAVWLPPAKVSSGSNAASEDCEQGNGGHAVTACGNSLVTAAGTANTHYVLTFSSK